MKSWMAGLARGTQGAANKYGQIQDEQRKFNQDQQKLQAEDLRKRRYAEFNYELKDSYTASGTMEGGRELTKREAALTPPEGTTRQSKIEYEAQVKAEAEQKQLDKTLAAEGRAEGRAVTGEKRRAGLAEEKSMEQLGDDVDPETGRRLTKKEAVEWNDSGKQSMPRWDYQQKQRSELKSVQDKEKAVNKIVMSDDPLMTEYQKNQQIADIVGMTEQGSEGFSTLMKNKKVREAVGINKLTEDALVIQAEGKSKQEIIDGLIAKLPAGLPETEKKNLANKAYKAAKDSGEMVDAFGPAWMTGAKGQGN